MKRFFVLALIALMTGCGGGGGGGGGSAPAPALATSSSTTATIRLNIPNPTTASSIRRTQFIGADVQGVALKFFAHTDSAHANPSGGGTFNVSTSSGLCTPATGVRTCTLTASTQVGTEDIVVTTYDALPVAGSFSAAHQLGTGTIFNVALAVNAPNTYNVAVGGTVASVGLNPQGQMLSGNSAGSYTLGFTAYDADNQMILAGSNTVTNGSGNTETDTFSNPITFTAAEVGGSGHTRLSLNGSAPATSVTVQTSSATISVLYDGLATSGYSASVGAAASGASPATAFVSFRFGGRIYVANYGADSITVYTPSPSGAPDEAPVATIVGSNTGLAHPCGMAFDASGNIYVANKQNNSITVYAANPVGTLNQPPILTIIGGNTRLNSPEGIAVDSAGTIYVTNNSSNEVTIYAANMTGTVNATPVGILTGSGTSLSQPSGIALDPTGKIYVANQGTVTVTVYSTKPIGAVDETPSTEIGGRNTTLNPPYALVIDANGRIDVADSMTNPQILVFAAGLVGFSNVAPVATIAGTNTNLAMPEAIALDNSGSIYVANTTGNSVTVYAPNPTGSLNEFPTATIQGVMTGLNQPDGIGIH